MRERLFERVERIEEKLVKLSEALDDLRGVDEADDICDAIGDRIIRLSSERDAALAKIEAIDDREREDEIRGYWRSVI